MKTKTKTKLLVNWWLIGGYLAFIVLFCLTSFIGGQVFDLYDNTAWFDKLLHAIGGAFFAVVGFSVYFALSGGKISDGRPTFLVALFAFCFSITIAVLWEFFEFAMDTMFGMNMLRWKDKDHSAQGMGAGLTDTMWDMILGAGAAFVVCFIGWLWLRRGKKPSAR